MNEPGTFEVIYGIKIPIHSTIYANAAASFFDGLEAWDWDNEKIINHDSLMDMLRYQLRDCKDLPKGYLEIGELCESIGDTSYENTLYRLTLMSPMNYIKQCLRNTTIVTTNTSPEKAALLRFYSTYFADDEGQDFFNKAYDAVNGRGGDLVLLIILFILDRLFDPFLISGPDMEFPEVCPVPEDTINKDLQEEHDVGFNELFKEKANILDEDIPTTFPDELVDIENPLASYIDDEGYIYQDTSRPTTLQNIDYDRNTFYKCPYSMDLTSIPILLDDDVIYPLVPISNGKPIASSAVRIPHLIDEVDHIVESSGRNNFANISSEESEIDFIKNKLDVLESIAKKSLNLNNHDKWRSLISLIYSVEIKKLSSQESSSSTSSIGGIPTGGRVQHLFRGKTKSKRSGKAEKLKETLSIERDYRYHVNNQESKELIAIYHANKEFQRIPETFFEYGLVFFEGDYMRVVELALLIIENEVEELFKEFKYDSLSMITNYYCDDEGNLAQILRNTKNEQVTNEKWTSYGKITPTRSIPKRTQRVDVVELIDLHHFTSEEAVVKVTKVLEAWWAKELEDRVQDGLLHKYGSLAIFNKPLIIVTGRGIHSTNGPVLKPTIEKLLKKKNFVYVEESFGFHVTGRKR